MAFPNPLPLPALLPLLTILILIAPADAFGAGYVARGSAGKGVNFRHGDIASAVYFFATANALLVKRIYFGNWLRDFSQLLDTRSIELVPEPILRAVVSVFGFIQFGYCTGEFEVTSERLGRYRPEEHIDNPKGYDGGLHRGLRAPVQEVPELEIDERSGMKNYIANQDYAEINRTSHDYVREQLVAAITCARMRDQEAYVHLGAAMHTIEDFVAHSNYVELCMRMIGRRMAEDSKLSPALSKVFAFVGDGVTVQTSQGPAPPLVTGTFGALDLYQTLLGEVDDKATAMTLPGLQLRTPQKESRLQDVTKNLIASLKGVNASGFDSDIGMVAKSAMNSKAADWGELTKAPEMLWQAIEPVFRLRDNIVKWISEHLKIKAVQNAIASISTALDKMVYYVIGVFLGPVLIEISQALKDQKEELLVRDREARKARSELSIFDDNSVLTDPTHSELCKDHYDNDLNEIAGRLAVTFHVLCADH